MGLIKYKGPQFKFDHPAYKPECVIDYDFKPKLDIVNEAARKYGIFIYTTSSFRLNSDNIKGAVVVPAKKSDHFIGHAEDFNLFYSGKFYNKAAIEFEYTHNSTGVICQFLKEIEHLGLRYGGDFADHDYIHIDDDLYHVNPKLWEEKYKLYHSSL